MPYNYIFETSKNYARPLSNNLTLNIAYKEGVEIPEGIDPFTKIHEKEYLLNNNFTDTTGSSPNNHLCDLMIGCDRIIDNVRLLNNDQEIRYAEIFNNRNPRDFTEVVKQPSINQRELINLSAHTLPFPYNLNLGSSRPTFGGSVLQGDYVKYGNSVFQSLREENLKPIPYGIYSDYNSSQESITPFEQSFFNVLDIDQDKARIPGSGIKGVTILSKFFRRDAPIDEPVNRVWNFNTQQDFFKLQGIHNISEFIDEVSLTLDGNKIALTANRFTVTEGVLNFEKDYNSVLPLSYYYSNPQFVPKKMVVSWRQDLLKRVYPNTILAGDNDLRWIVPATYGYKNVEIFFGIEAPNGLDGAVRFCHYWDKHKKGDDYPYWYMEDRNYTFHWGDNDAPYDIPDNLYYDKLINGIPYRQKVSVTYTPGTVVNDTYFYRKFECNLNQYSKAIPNIWYKNLINFRQTYDPSLTVDNLFEYRASSPYNNWNAYDLNSKVSVDTPKTTYEITYLPWSNVLVNVNDPAFFDGLPFIDGLSEYEWVISEPEAGEPPKYLVSDVGQPEILPYGYSVTAFDETILYDPSDMSGFIVFDNIAIEEIQVLDENQEETIEFLLPVGNCFTVESPLIYDSLIPNGINASSIPSWVKVGASINYIYINGEGKPEISTTTISSVENGVVGLSGIFPPTDVSFDKIYREFYPNDEENLLSLRLGRLRIQDDIISLYEGYDESEFQIFVTNVPSNMLPKIFNKRKIQLWRSEDI